MRSRAGTDPCKMFTTNSSEAINHIIKQEVQWRENKLPTLIEHLKTITAQHQAELEKAIIGRGEWHFCSEYTYLQVSESVWFSSMKSEAKDKHLKKVQTCQLKQPSPSATAESQIASAGADRGATCSTRLSVSVQNCGLSKVSQSTLEGIWKKAEILIHSVGNILKAPWISDEKARLVKSLSSPQPHVQRNSKNKSLYYCDSNCQMFKGFSICSHVVAVAEVNGDLQTFLNCLQKKCVPNLSAIATHGLPCGTGRKGGIPKRKRKSVKPIETRSVRQCFHDQSTSQSCSPEDFNEVSGMDEPVAGLNTPCFAVPIASYAMVSTSTIAPAIATGTLPHSTAVTGALPRSTATTGALSLPRSTAATGALPRSTAATGALSLPRPTAATGALPRSTAALPHSALAMGTLPHSALALSTLLHSVSTAGSLPYSTLHSSVTLHMALSPSSMATNAHRQHCPVQSNTHARASSAGQVVNVNGTGVNVNIATSTPGISQAYSRNDGGNISNSAKQQEKPFTLKLKTKQIRICQACRKDYDGANDTLGLVVARAERRLVSNLSTGVQFLGRESNSHYHAHMNCLKIADASFTGQKLIIPDEVLVKLDTYQKVYLSTCLEVPFEVLNIYI